MRLTHKIVGLVIVVTFLLTGQYMEFTYGEWVGVPLETRMMYRSRHIYILLAGLLNLALGLYLTRQAVGWRKVTQAAGSALILAAPFALVAAFFIEPATAPLERCLTLPGVVSLFAGSLLHLIATARQKDAPRAKASAATSGQ